MKRSILLFLAIWLISVASAQETVSIRKKVGPDKVPEIVTLHFNEQYKNVHVIGWYATHISYWYDDAFVMWYQGWYNNREVTVYTFQKPSYYEVEFIDEPGELSRALYSRYGAWFETRTKINGLPVNIDESLKNSEFAGWKRSGHMEKLEIPEMHGYIYRLLISKGTRKQVIRINDQGQIIQIKIE